MGEYFRKTVAEIAIISLPMHLSLPMEMAAARAMHISTREKRRTSVWISSEEVSAFRVIIR